MNDSSLTENEKEQYKFIKLLFVDNTEKLKILGCD